MNKRLMALTITTALLFPVVALGATARVANGSADPSWQVRPTTRTDSLRDTGLLPVLLKKAWVSCTAGVVADGAWVDTSVYSTMVFSINMAGSATVTIESSSSTYSAPTGVGVTTHTYYGNTVPTLLTDVGAWTRVRITQNACVDCNGGPSGAATAYVNAIFRF